MRAWIPSLDTSTIPWEATPLTGVFGKTLNSDPDTQARTGMVVFKDGASVPGRPHYHDTDEEILVTKGLVTFDHRTWLPSRGYIYNAPRTVHGFKSGTQGETVMLARHNGIGPLVLNFIEGEPAQDDWYQVSGEPPRREPAYITDFTEMPSVSAEDGSETTVLSLHPDTKQGSIFIRLPPGWRGAAPAIESRGYREIFVVEGDVQTTDGHALREAFYAFIPPGVAHGFTASDQGALIFVSVGGEA